jgi:hypothetical protein
MTCLFMAKRTIKKREGGGERRLSPASSLILRSVASAHEKHASTLQPFTQLSSFLNSPISQAQ